GEIPDGFYLVDDSEHPQPEFQDAVIAAVAKVTHIAPADANGEIIGSKV
ncbi:MAG: peptidase, partial [Xanthomonadales bacterium]|nr:peptidase [Xanthomonadales bacterium]